MSELELFRAIASGMLDRRIRNMRRLDENTRIDTSLITHAEYQLFLDDMYAQNEYHQPDQWKEKRFPLGKSKSPVVGIRPSDAEAFCKWLSKQGLGKFRLPYNDETQSMEDSSPGFWQIMNRNADKVEYRYKGKIHTHDIGVSLEGDFDLDVALNLDLAWGLDNVSARARNLALDLDRDRDRARARAFDLDFNRDRAIACAQSLDNELDFDLTIASLSDIALYLALYRDLDRDRAIFHSHTRARDSAYNRIVDLERNQQHALKRFFELDNSNQQRTPIRVHNLDEARALALNLAHDHADALFRALAFQRAIDRELELELVLTLVPFITRSPIRDFIHNIEQSLERKPERDFISTLAYNEILFNTLALDLAFDQDLKDDFIRTIKKIRLKGVIHSPENNLDLNTAKDFILDLTLDHALIQTHKPKNIHIRDNALVIALDRCRVLGNVLNRAFARMHERERERENDVVPVGALDSAIDHFLDHTIDSTLNRKIDRDLDRATKLDHDLKTGQKLLQQITSNLAVLSLRREGLLPAFEGILIVREED